MPTEKLEQSTMAESVVTLETPALKAKEAQVMEKDEIIKTLQSKVNQRALVLATYYSINILHLQLVVDLTSPRGVCLRFAAYSCL